MHQRVPAVVLAVIVLLCVSIPSTAAYGLELRLGIGAVRRDSAETAADRIDKGGGFRDYVACCGARSIPTAPSFNEPMEADYGSPAGQAAPSTPQPSAQSTRPVHHSHHVRNAVISVALGAVLLIVLAAAVK